MLTSAMLRHGLRPVNGKTQGSSHRREKACSPKCSETSDKVTKTANIGQKPPQLTPAFIGPFSKEALLLCHPAHCDVQIRESVWPPRCGKEWVKSMFEGYG